MPCTVKKESKSRGNNVFCPFLFCFLMTQNWWGDHHLSTILLASKVCTYSDHCFILSYSYRVCSSPTSFFLLKSFWQYTREREREREMGNNDNLPLFVTKSAKGPILFQFIALTIFVGICLISVYRLTHIPERKEAGRWAWMGLFLSGLWFFFIYWFFTMVVRLNPHILLHFQRPPLFQVHMNISLFHMLFNMCKNICSGCFTC